ncbi:MAG: hypothetical protein RI996_49 [Candidatus Parcubacteria bacterium]|jgi:ferritin-like metal-binding protein YciE
MSFISGLTQKISELFGGAKIDAATIGDTVNQKVEGVIDTMAEKAKEMTPDAMDGMVEKAADIVADAATDMVDTVQAKAGEMMK